MALSADLAECMQVWWVEITFLVSFLLGWALLRGKWGLGGEQPAAVPQESGEAFGANGKADDARGAPGGTEAMRELLRFLKQGLEAVPDEAAHDARAIDLFRQARLSGCRLDQAKCCELLEQGAKLGLRHFVSEVARFARARMLVDAALCSSLMRAYMAVGLPEDAKCVYDEATSRHVEMDEEADDLYDEILAKAVAS